MKLPKVPWRSHQPLAVDCCSATTLSLLLCRNLLQFYYNGTLAVVPSQTWILNLASSPSWPAAEEISSVPVKIWSLVLELVARPSMVGLCFACCFFWLCCVWGNSTFSFWVKEKDWRLPSSHGPPCFLLTVWASLPFPIQTGRRTWARWRACWTFWRILRSGKFLAVAHFPPWVSAAMGILPCNEALEGGSAVGFPPAPLATGLHCTVGPSIAQVFSATSSPIAVFVLLSPTRNGTRIHFPGQPNILIRGMSARSRFPREGSLRVPSFLLSCPLKTLQKCEIALEKLKNDMAVVSEGRIFSSF